MDSYFPPFPVPHLGTTSPDACSPNSLSPTSPSSPSQPSASSLVEFPLSHVRSLFAFVQKLLSAQDVLESLDKMALETFQVRKRKAANAEELRR